MAMSPARSSEDRFQRFAVEVGSLLSGAKRILISSHQSPDGDAVASLLATARIVELLGSQPFPALEGTIPKRFAFLPGANLVLRLQDLMTDSFEAMIVVDCGSLARIGEIAVKISQDLPVLNIDHHPDNKQFGTVNVVNPQASSTSELLYDIIVALHLPLDLPLATLLYTGLMTDTGSFRYANASPHSFAVAEHLTRIGVNPAVISGEIYSANSLGAVKVLGQALNSLELRAGGRVAVATIQQQEDQEEPEDLMDFFLTVKGVRVVVLFRRGEDQTRVSMRALDPYDVARIARRYGGGGHQKAAGFTWYGTPDEIRNRLLAELDHEVKDAGPESTHPVE